MTYQPKAEFLRVMTERGYMKDCTDLEQLDKAFEAGVVPAYIGFDCTAESLHVGSLLQIMMLRWLQKTGHKPIVLMGGGTTKIGDPSGKDESRAMLDAAGIEKNKRGIFSVFDKYMTFGDGPTDAIMLDNADWLDELNYISFLRDYGPHFTVNRMLTFDSVKLRLEREQPLTFLEFNYMLLQAYDFLELHRRVGCKLQLGGSDQWGNIINGIELGRRVDQAELYGITTPLITTSDGAKMGKSANGAIWLNADMRSPYEFWQFWRNTSDADVGRFLRLFTELPLDECARLEALEGQEINEAKKILATEITTLCHGADAAAQAEEAARVTFEQGALSDDLPTVTLNAEDVGEGISISALFVMAGLAKSGKDAKRLIGDGGGKLDDGPIEHPGLMLTAEDLKTPRKLSAGKKRHALAKMG
jgi:tyrosyl-tRNA synthetase